jgi:hypothetical protein
METIFPGIIPLFITGLAFVAYKHPKGYKTIFYVLLSISLITFVALISYNYGISTAIWNIPTLSNEEGYKNIYETLKQKEVSYSWLIIIFILFTAYLFILYHLHRILKNSVIQTPIKTSKKNY